MKNISLTEDEIKAIKRFLYQAERINLIQCVYLCSYFNEEKNMDIVEITSVVNYPKQVSEFGEGTYSAGTKYLYDKTRNLINESNNGRLVFITDSCCNYSIQNVENINYLSSKKLISSTILLEDLSRFEKIKGILSTKIEPYSNINTIDNIDEVVNTFKGKTKKKTIF